jgi:hypothetical protein
MSPQWVLTVLVSESLETSMSALRVELVERARSVWTLFPGLDLEAQRNTAELELHMVTIPRVALMTALTRKGWSSQMAETNARGVVDEGAEACPRLSALRSTVARRLAVAIRLAAVGNTVHSASGTLLGETGMTMLAITPLVVEFSRLSKLFRVFSLPSVIP